MVGVLIQFFGAYRNKVVNIECLSVNSRSKPLHRQLRRFYWASPCNL